MSRCLVCKSAAVEKFLDLGRTALANRFLAGEELYLPEPKFPLVVGFCHACTHVQLTEIVPPGALFTDYLYVSSASDLLKTHLHELSDVVINRFNLGRDDLVVDLGCNDGTLLQGFQRYGVRTLGVDPARNLAELTKAAQIERYVGFFGSKSAEEIKTRWGLARIIIATNTFPHIPDLSDFVAGLNTLLAPGGAVVLEMHYLLDLIEQGAFDTIYHEHVSYWALKPLVTLFETVGMEVVLAERLPLHHGQLRVTIRRKGEAPAHPSVEEILEDERAKGLDQFRTYGIFTRRVAEIKRTLRGSLLGLRSDGKRIAGYGAPAKASTLLEYLGLGVEVLQYIVDRSPLKQGRYTPGLHIPVVSPDRLVVDRPDYVLLLAWNFVDEIIHQQTAYRMLGGKFIVPVPQIRII